MTKSGLFPPACKFDDASTWQAARSEHAARSSSRAIMSALLLNTGKVMAGAAEAWRALFVRLARFRTPDDRGTPSEEPVTVDNCRVSSSVGVQACPSWHLSVLDGLCPVQ